MMGKRFVKNSIMIYFFILDISDLVTFYTTNYEYIAHLEYENASFHCQLSSFTVISCDTHGTPKLHQTLSRCFLIFFGHISRKLFIAIQSFDLRFDALV
mmetsp:Transcript_6890/g.10173  ORF Transcript_6890/g.10173 Transcript_6890/m.10173 type:complete len:99 (-) Transcript_6890:501-797(-)